MAPAGAAYTLAQNIVGRACGADGVSPGTYCEPIISTVASQDTTGPMNRTELEELACLGFGADLVLQSFCHTARPTPNPATSRPSGPSRPSCRYGAGSCCARAMASSTAGSTACCSRTRWVQEATLTPRFPLGISFPAGSGLVWPSPPCYGAMPIDMPESALVRFSGRPQPGITVRDLVHAIPHEARRRGLLTLDPASKNNVFGGRIVEIEGLERLSVEQAFELSDSTAERSAAVSTIALGQESVERHLESSVALIRQLVDAGYQDACAHRAASRGYGSMAGQPDAASGGSGSHLRRCRRHRR